MSESHTPLQMIVTGAILATFMEKGSTFDVSAESLYDDDGDYIPVVKITGNQSGEVVTVEVNQGRMSAQGDDFTDRLIRGAAFDASQEQIETVIGIMVKATVEIRTEAGWPARWHLFRPGEYVADGRTWEEYVGGVLVPVRGPVDLWRRSVKNMRDSLHPDEG